MPTRALAYTIEARQIGGSLRGFILTRCSGCKEEHRTQWAGHHNPNHIAKHFRRLGWDFNAFRTNGNKCPNCNGSGPQRFLPDTGSTDLKTLGGRIHYMRLQTHLSVERLATEAKIPLVLLTRLEANEPIPFTSGTSDLDQAIPIRLADVFARHGASVDAAWLNGVGESTSVLAVNLRRLMQNKDHTEGSLAAAAHIRPSVIRAILSGQIEECYAIDKIAHALGCRIETLTANPKTDEPNQSAAASAAISLFKPKAEIEPRPKLLSSLVSGIPGWGPPQPGRVHGSSWTTPAKMTPAPKAEAPNPVQKVVQTANGSTPAIFGDNPGETLKAARLKAGLSQSDLARKIAAKDGVSSWKSTQALISWIERNGKIGARGTTARHVLDIIPSCLPMGRATRKSVAVSTTETTASVPSVVHASSPDLELLMKELRKATDDLDGLRSLVDEVTQKYVADLSPLRQMIIETQQKVESIGQAIASVADKSHHPDHRVRNYLKLIRGVWFYRRRVPDDARHVFKRTEMCVCLDTSDRQEALQRRLPYATEFDMKLSKARAK